MCWVHFQLCVLLLFFCIIVVQYEYEYEWERGACARVFLFFSIYFALLHLKTYLYFILICIFSWGHDCTLKWNWKTTTKRSETIRYDTIHAFYEWNRHNVIFLYSRDFALYAHDIYTNWLGRRRFTIGVERRFSTEHETHFEQPTKPTRSRTKCCLQSSERGSSAPLTTLCYIFERLLETHAKQVK